MAGAQRKAQVEDDVVEPKSLHQWLKDWQQNLASGIDGIPFGNPVRVQNESDIAIARRLLQAVRDVPKVTEEQFLNIAERVRLTTVALRTEKCLSGEALDAACTGAALMLARCIPAVLRAK